MLFQVSSDGVKYIARKKGVETVAVVHDDRKSHTGKYITLGYLGPPIAIKSNKQRMVADSSTEAELIALHDSLDLLMWCRKIMDRGNACCVTRKF